MDRLLSNNIMDPYFGWQMTQNIFQEFINEKYDSTVSRNEKYYILGLIGMKIRLLFCPMPMMRCLTIKRNTMLQCS